MDSGSYFMAMNKSDKTLIWIAGAVVVLEAGILAYKKNLEMRMAGASTDDAFLFMVMVFIGIIAIIGIIVGFVFYFLFPEGENIYKGLRKKRKLESPKQSTVTEEPEKINHDKKIQRQEAELKRQR